MDDHIKKYFGHKLRFRACGICIENNRILMVKHEGVGPHNILWAPPGGGLEWKTSTQKQLYNEILEEIGLLTTVQEFLFCYEIIDLPIHAIELFFYVTTQNKNIKKGIDPEMKSEDQIIKEVKFMDFSEIKSLPPTTVHHLFTYCNSLNDIFNLKGYFKFENNSVK